MEHKRTVLRSWLNRTTPSLYATALPQPPLKCEPVALESKIEAPYSSNIVSNRRRTQLYSRIYSEPHPPKRADHYDEASPVKLPLRVALKYPSNRPKPLQINYTPVISADPPGSTPQVEELPQSTIIVPKKRAAINHKVERGRWLTLHDNRRQALQFFARADADLFEGAVVAPHSESTIDDDAATPPIVLEHYAKLTLQVLRTARNEFVRDRRA